MAAAEIPPGWIATGILVEAIEAIDGLGSTPMPVALASKVCKIINWGRPIHSGFLAARNDIIHRYGTSVGEGKFNIPADRVGLFNAAICAIQFEPTAELPSEYILSLDDFSDLKLTPSQYSRIRLFIKE